jgi:glycerol-3-phosphate acyltransferase PlsY
VGIALLALLAGYLLGTIPTAVIVARRTGHDPTREGSRNPGASNVYRVAGRGAGVAAIVGHTLPPWGHRGGKGVATAGGMVLALYPLVGLGALVLWLVLVRLTGKASVASLVVVAVVPVGVALVGRPGGEVAAVAVVSGYIVIRHAGNIARLLSGREQTVRPRPPT